MKRYLDLVPISAKVHRKQSRMSIFCIVLSVFLVTAIFGMADMFVRSQIAKTQAEAGNWHVGIQGISGEDASVIATRPDVNALAPNKATALMLIAPVGEPEPSRWTGIAMQLMPTSFS